MARDGKLCFVIAPIGRPGSEERQRSDDVLNGLIKPAAESVGFRLERADQIEESGLITTQVVRRLVEAEMVVADLTGRNPNVFYELAVRHAARKPVVQMITEGEDLPFDVKDVRTVAVPTGGFAATQRCIQELATKIKSAYEEPTPPANPVSAAVDLHLLAQSGQPGSEALAELIERMSELRALVLDSPETGGGETLHLAALVEALAVTAQIPVQMGGPPPRMIVEAIDRLAMRAGRRRLAALEDRFIQDAVEVMVAILHRLLGDPEGISQAGLTRGDLARMVGLLTVLNPGAGVRLLRTLIGPAG